MQKESNSKHGMPFGWHISSQRMVTATEVNNGRSCGCVCAACGARLQARQGAIRAWYFAHDEETNCQNAPEAAIHRMAKQMIAERGCVFVPHRMLSRTIHGKRGVWTETIKVDVQSAGLQILTDCTQEKTIGDSRIEGESRRPDVFALLEGYPLAIEILNTHAVDFEKQEWLERQGYSILEIDVADIKQLSPDHIPEALEVRLFKTSDFSIWLSHAKDPESKKDLDLLEARIRAERSTEEHVLLARLEAKEAEQKRKEEAFNRRRDIDARTISVGRCTVRVGLNRERVSLKVHGYCSETVFKGITLLGRKHGGKFNQGASCWEFYRHSEIEIFFYELFDQVKQECIERSFGVSLPPTIPKIEYCAAAETPLERPLPIYFTDPNRQEAFEERAAVLEFEAGFKREDAEAKALAQITASHPNNSNDIKVLMTA